MKRFYFILLMVLLAGCSGSSDSTLIINGTADSKYDGTKIYLVPQPRPTADIVDSAFIKKGKFTFKVKADSVYVSHIAVTRKSKARLERILVVIEPGVLNVHLDTISTAHGTPLNEKLQNWKTSMQQSYKTKNSANLEHLTIDFIKDNPNPLGGFIYLMYDRVITPEQRAELDSLGINKWKPDVSKR